MGACTPLSEQYRAHECVGLSARRAELVEGDGRALPADVGGIGPAHEDHGVGEPGVGQRERVTRFLGTEDRRRDPARRVPGVGGREHQVLDRGPERQQRHSPLGALANLVGIPVEAVPREAAEHERRCLDDLPVRRVDELVDPRRRDAVGLQVAPPARAHAEGEVLPGGRRVDDRPAPRT